MQISQIRQNFPILKVKVRDKNLIYFDNAATTQKPQAVINSIVDYYANKYSSTHSQHTLATDLITQLEQAREVVSKFIKANSKEEIVFTKGATESFNLLAFNIDSLIQFDPGDKILLTEAEHHANLVPWQRLAKDKNLNLEFIKILDDGSLDLDDLKKKLTKKTKLISFTQVSNVLGLINPLKKIIKTVKELSPAKIIIDGTQAIPHLEVNLQDLDPDFYIFSGHKVFGPTGVGILYGKKGNLDKLKPYQVGGEMVKHVDLFFSNFQETPYKFEAGTLNFAGIIGLKKALEYFSLIKKEVFFIDNKALSFYEYEEYLGKILVESIRNLKNIRLLGLKNPRVPLISFWFPDVNSLDLAMYLDLRGIAVRAGRHCSHPLHDKFFINSSLRASLSFYNTLEEINYFAENLKEGLEFLRKFG